MIFYYMVASVSDPDPGYFQAMDPDPDLGGMGMGMAAHLRLISRGKTTSLDLA